MRRTRSRSRIEKLRFPFFPSLFVFSPFLLRCEFFRIQSIINIHFLLILHRSMRPFSRSLRALRASRPSKWLAFRLHDLRKRRSVSVMRDVGWVAQSPLSAFRQICTHRARSHVVDCRSTVCLVLTSGSHPLYPSSLRPCPQASQVGTPRGPQRRPQSRPRPAIGTCAELIQLVHLSM